MNKFYNLHSYEIYQNGKLKKVAHGMKRARMYANQLMPDLWSINPTWSRIEIIDQQTGEITTIN